METGDEGAFTHIVRKHHKAIYNIVRGIVRNHEDAEEIANDTFMRAFNKREEIREPEKLIVWLKRTAKNLAIDAIRKSRQARYFPAESLSNLSVGERDFGFASILRETDAEQTQTNEDMMKSLLLLLPDKDREVVRLEYEEGLSPKEIAAIGSTADAVQKRRERIVKWLKPIALHLEVLVDYLPEERDRWIMERYLDGQPLSDIARAIGISGSIIEQTVKRVVAQWKKAAKQNPTDPVSVMVENER